MIEQIKPPFNLTPKLEECSLNDINMLILSIERANTTSTKPARFVIEQIKQMDQNKLVRKIKDKESPLNRINNFIVNVKKNDVESSNYIFELISQPDLTEKFKESNQKNQGLFMQNIMGDIHLYRKYQKF